MKIIRVVDLSHTVSEQTQVYPGDPVPHLEQHSTVKIHGFNLTKITMGSQSGTHIDAPSHFGDGYATLENIPLTKFLGTGVIIDCGQLSPRQRITAAPIANQLEGVKPGQMAIFRTGWDKYFGTPTYFDNPFLDEMVVKMLLDRGVVTFGLDALNIDETPKPGHPGEGFPCHHLVARAEGVICENLTNLEAVDFPEPMFSLLPLKFSGIDGAPIRAVALELGES